MFARSGASGCVPESESFGQAPLSLLRIVPIQLDILHICRWIDRCDVMVSEGSGWGSGFNSVHSIVKHRPREISFTSCGYSRP